jgi:membrane fusion protein, multidrug efflux system
MRNRERMLPALTYRTALAGLLALNILLQAAGPQTTEAVRVIPSTPDRKERLPGEFLPFLQVAIHAKVEGFVENVKVDRGSLVREGEVLATMTAPELDAQRAEAEARVRTAESQNTEADARLVAAQSTYDRMKSASATEGVIAGNELVQAEKQVDAEQARVKAAEATVRAAQAALKSVDDLRAYLTVTAPFSGVITTRNIHPGALVGAGKDSEPMFELETTNRLRLVVPVPEADVGAIVKGTRVSFSVPAYPGETFNGVVSRISRSLDPKIRAMPVELDVPNPNGRLAAGMYPSVNWPVRGNRSLLLVPPSSIVNTSERTFLIRVKNGAAEWVDVKRGAPQGELVEVIGRLSAGDVVLRRGSDEIRQGTHVNTNLVGAAR